MKRRIRQNVWGNWKTYLGARCVHDFGTDETSAREWLIHGEWMGLAVDSLEPDPFGTATFWIENGRVKSRPGVPEWWGK